MSAAVLIFWRLPRGLDAETVVPQNDAIVPLGLLACMFKGDGEGQFSERPGQDG